jgi:antitoxin CptB
MDRTIRLKRLSFRASHRGTREADYMIGGFFDQLSASWDEAEIAWFEELMHEQDVDIMGWALGTIPIPARWQGPMMDRFRKLDFITVER